MGGPPSENIKISAFFTHSGDFCNSSKKRFWLLGRRVYVSRGEMSVLFRVINLHQRGRFFVFNRAKERKKERGEVGIASRLFWTQSTKGNRNGRIKKKTSSTYPEHIFFVKRFICILLDQILLRWARKSKRSPYPKFYSFRDTKKRTPIRPFWATCL